ncbi:hypothetical protein M1L60_03490 [Actinoplanes sp. TRM 88003]|uniref:Uncharacterized protein n=1 Tax=Paractinoplanes aksuensis TaxID=2939490 RepID=A0ABT1DFP5_9ACTN|nr:hypothetical protein [Actinoplanes aksuensis]MCO8269652.1 hypothetical protein [Actinoplanes aksuensis]
MPPRASPTAWADAQVGTSAAGLTFGQTSGNKSSVTDSVFSVTRAGARLAEHSGMAHVVLGRVVLGEAGGLAVEGVTVQSHASGWNEGPDEQVVTTAMTASDGRFVLVFNFVNLSEWAVRILSPAGVLVREIPMVPPGDMQETFDDLGELIIPFGQGGLELPRRPRAAPPRPRVGGRVVDSGGRCSIHCLQVLIEATTAGHETFRPLAVGRTDKSGRFFVEYPNVAITTARALIPGVADPIPLPTELGLIAPEPLIVIDVEAAEHEHETSGCTCGSATDVPRLPGQDDLAESSSTYSADLGAGCVNFTAPNRAIEEFDFWTVVRTSQPAVSDDADFEAESRRDFGDRQVVWDGEPELFQAVAAAHGHLLHFRQTWFADGYSLGDLLYSLPLAPGQKKLISVVDWQREESATRREDTVFSESVNADLQRNRDVTEVISAALAEQSRGGSTSSVWGVGAGTGGAGNGSYQGFNFGALFGISGGFSRADSEAWQNSSRNFASTSMNSLRDRVMQAASAIRGIRSSVVSTVGESEAVRAETDVVANHNRCHALTIQYFEVLRHFQMRHDLVEVKECLFVPLPMGPFDPDKALRWRDQIEPYLLRPELSGAMEALRRVRTDWQDETTPENRYADETVTDISGEFEIEFLAYPPPLPAVTDTSAAATALEQSAGAIIASIFFPPLAVAVPAAITSAASNAVSALKAQANEDLKYRKFHRDYMPRFAARFVNGLTLGVIRSDGSRTAATGDFTLASRYQADRRLLVSFRATVTGVRRADIASLTVESNNGVPDAVRCVVRSLRCDYATDSFGHRLAAETRLNDDLDGPRLVPTGTFPLITFTADASTADPVRVRTALDSWERRSPRNEDRRRADRLMQHLNANIEYYHHAIWWSMDPSRRYMLLDGYHAPNGGGRSVAQVVENKLIGIVGNSLVLPVAPGNRLDPLIRMAENQPETTDDDPSGLFAYYAPPTPVPPARISLPTKGVFAEAVMGACNACERIDDSRFWRWEDYPLDEPPAIGPTSTDSRSDAPPDATPTPYPAPIVNVQNAPSAPDPSSLSTIAQLLGQESFRDLTGLTGTQANAAAAYKQNLESALAFGKEASELAKQAGMLAAKDRAFAAIDSAEADGKITSEEAHGLRMSALKKVVGDTSSADAGVEITKKKLGVIDDAGKAGVVDPQKAMQLSGSILDDFAAGDRIADPERNAAARKIAEMAPGDVSSVEIQRNGDTTKVTGPAAPDGSPIIRASTSSDWIAWRGLLDHRVSYQLAQKLLQRRLYVVPVTAGRGDVNLDYYPAQISKLPILEGVQTTPESLLDYVRRHFDEFFDTDNSSFPPLDAAIDGPVWESDNPVGTVIDIQVNVLSPLLPPFPMTIDRSLVVCSHFDARHWIFSTLVGPPEHSAGHPVSGNRMWGIDPYGDGWTLYTMGADRVTTALESGLNSITGVAWRGADRLWTSFQMKVAAFVNANQGVATASYKRSERFDWDVIAPQLAVPLGEVEI